MSSVTPEAIRDLDDVAALTAARSLVVLLELELGGAGAGDAAAGDPEQLVAQGSEATRAIARALETADQQDAAACARALLLACLRLGYEEQVGQALASADAHVLDMGLLSGPVIVAALAAVIAWVPVDSRRRLHEVTKIGPDGSVETVREIEEQVLRAGPEAVRALKDWWIHAFEA